MNTQMVGLLLRSTAAIASDPALGYRGAAVVSALNLAAIAVERGEEGVAALEQLSAQVAAMAQADRPPTKEEFGDLKARSDAAHAILNPPQETPSDEASPN